MQALKYMSEKDNKLVAVQAEKEKLAEELAAKDNELVAAKSAKEKLANELVVVKAEKEKEKNMNTDEPKALVETLALLAAALKVGGNLHSARGIDQELRQLPPVSLALVTRGDPEREHVQVEPRSVLLVHLLLERLELAVPLCVLGDQLLNKVRGKAITIHSQLITEFCQDYGVQPKTRGGLIKKAKNTGDKLGFLS